MQNIVALFPNLGLPNLPAVPVLTGVTISDTHAYIFGGGDISDVSAQLGLTAGKSWQFAPGFGLGTELQLSNGSALDIWAGYFNPADGFSLGPAQVSQGRKLIAGLNWLF